MTTAHYDKQDAYMAKDMSFTDWFPAYIEKYSNYRVSCGAWRFLLENVSECDDVERLEVKLRYSTTLPYYDLPTALIDWIKVAVVTWRVIKS